MKTANAFVKSVDKLKNELNTYRFKVGRLVPSPNPQPSSEDMAIASLEDKNSRFRKHYCRFYSACLDVAANSQGLKPGKWKSFTCQFCHVEEKITPEDVSRDTEGLLKLYNFLTALERKETYENSHASGKVGNGAEGASINGEADESGSELDD